MKSFLFSIYTMYNIIFILSFRYYIADRVCKYYNLNRIYFKKCKESLCEIFHYSLSFISGYFLLKDKDWVYNKSKWYDCYKYNLTMTFYEDAYYLMYAARYMALLIIMTFDHKRKDYIEMVLHHIATITIIILSYTSGFYYYGLLIMVLFDISDIFLHIAKVLQYIFKNDRIHNMRYSFISDVFFSLFAGSFLIIRDFCFPIISYEFFKYGVIQHGSVLHGILFLLLLVICFLQLFWSYLILKGFIIKITHSEVIDIRSDSEDEKNE